MEHRDVVTLFHEFGHLMHHVLGGRQEWARFSGVATEWDFVEAPSQMLEEWAWDADVLQTFATNAAGEPIPADLVDEDARRRRVRQGRIAARTQMFYASVSYFLHRDRAQARRPDRAGGRAPGAYDLFPFIEGTHFHASFGHLDGYTSGYYTYMWSLVIAKDLFSAFDRDDLFAPETAAALPRPGARAGRPPGRRRPGRGLPRPPLHDRRLDPLAQPMTPTRPGLPGSPCSLHGSPGKPPLPGGFLARHVAWSRGATCRVGRSVDGDGEAVEGVAACPRANADDPQVTLAGLRQDQPASGSAPSSLVVTRAPVSWVHAPSRQACTLTGRSAAGSPALKNFPRTTNCSPLAGVESETNALIRGFAGAAAAPDGGRCDQTRSPGRWQPTSSSGGETTNVHGDPHRARLVGPAVPDPRILRRSLRETFGWCDSYFTRRRYHADAHS